jgi:hypothetical protein
MKGSTHAALAAVFMIILAVNAQGQGNLGGPAAAVQQVELQQLASSISSTNPDVLIQTVEWLETLLGEVRQQYAQIQNRILAASDAEWEKLMKATSYSQSTTTAAEVETEFMTATRIEKEKKELNQLRQALLDRVLTDIETQQVSHTRMLQGQLDAALEALHARIWTISGRAVTLEPDKLDRTTNSWSFSVGSADPSIPMIPVTVMADLGKGAGFEVAAQAMDTAIKTGTLAAELDWSISRDSANNRYAIDIRSVRVRNTRDGSLYETRPNQRAAFFVAGQRTNPTVAAGIVRVTSRPQDGLADVYIGVTKVGRTPYEVRLAEGSYTIEVRWTDIYSRSYSRLVQINPGQTVTMTALGGPLMVGDRGPAGGYVFHDKGSVSNGWRYLEAAPLDSHAGIGWFNGNYRDIKTGVGIDSGKVNSAAIITTFGAGNYAAMVCRNLDINGYRDWFLPSKDELNLMYQNLKKAAIGDFKGNWYWTSSQYFNNMAWVQSFVDGYQSYDYLTKQHAVRAIRAF